MESDTIKESIDTLIKARPYASVANDPQTTNNIPSSLTKSLDGPSSRESRYTSLKRKSAALSAAKCNCGKCAKCVPSPSGKLD